MCGVSHARPSPKQGCTFLTLPGTLAFDDDTFLEGDTFGHQESELLPANCVLDHTAVLNVAAGCVSLDPGTPQASCLLLHPAPSLEASSLSASPEPSLHAAAYVPGDSSQCQPQAYPAASMATAAVLPLGLHGLRLQLDCDSVATAWHSMSGGRNPFQLSGPQLAAAAAAIPSAADLAASLVAAPLLPGIQHSGSGSNGDTGIGCARAGDKWSGKRSACAATAAVAGMPAEHRAGTALSVRRSASGKRPRIKGRFVSRAEYARAKAEQAAAAAAGANHAAARAVRGTRECAVPAAR